MHRKYILLVEDNIDDVDLTIRAFKRSNLRNEVDVAKDGEEAISRLLDESLPLPQVVLLDLQLPRINGLEVLKRLRNEPRTHQLPVVILTSSKEEKDLIGSYTLGANSFVRKPVDFHQFTEAVNQLGLYWLLLNEPASEKSLSPTAGIS